MSETPRKPPRKRHYRRINLEIQSPEEVELWKTCQKIAIDIDLPIRTLVIDALKLWLSNYMPEESP